MSGGKSDLCLFPQQLGPVLAPPPTPFPWGVGEFLPSTLNGRGPSSGPAGLGSSGGGGGSYSVPAGSHPVLSSHPLIYSPPRWRRKIFYFLLFITSDLGPLFFSINLSVLCETDRQMPQGLLLFIT